MEKATDRTSFSGGVHSGVEGHNCKAVLLDTNVRDAVEHRGRKLCYCGRCSEIGAVFEQRVVCSFPWPCRALHESTI